MEEVDSDHNGSNDGATATPQKDVSVGCWEAEKGMAEITVKRGKLWGSMGVIQNSKLYCHVEEAVYMVEQGSLLLLREGDNKPIACEEVYDLLVVPSYGCSWDSYQIFCHLKRLGYIVGRHGTPWSTSQSKGPPREPLPELNPKPELDVKLRGVLQTEVSSKSPACENFDEDCLVPDKLRRVLNTEMSSNTIPREDVDEDSLAQEKLRRVLNTAVSSNTIPFVDVDEGSLGDGQDKNKERDEELPLSKREELCVDATREILPSLFWSLELSKEGGPEKALDTKEEEGQRGLKIMFDVHLPNGRFKKTAPGFPAFSLCVVNGQEPPEQRQVRELEAKIGGQPLKFGTVDCGHVSIFSFSTRSLPTLP